MPRATRPQDAAAPAAAQGFVVVYHEDAVRELDEHRDRKVRRSIFTAVAILSQAGPKLIEPHAKKVQGAKKLRELRPSGGRSTVRPLYVQLDERVFVVLTIGPEAMDDPSGFRSAVARAQGRAARDFAIDA